MANSEDTAFLGTGWAFPPRFASGSRHCELSRGEEDIHQSLEILFSTSPGERIMHPDYGCRLNRFLFEELTQTTLTEIRAEIEHAVLFFESRIELLALVLTPDPPQGRLLIELDYRVVSTNNRGNLVYPFYLLEGTQIDPVLLPAP